MGSWAFILLNFVIVTVLSELYTHFGSLSGVKAIFYGVSPALIALILHSCYRLTKFEELWGPRTLTPHQPSVILPLLMRRGRLIGVLIVAGLVFLAPVVMAFGACAGMTAMCEGPCGASPCGAVSTAPHSIWLGPVTDLAPQGPERLPTANLSSLDPPPKPVLLSA